MPGVGMVALLVVLLAADGWPSPVGAMMPSVPAAVLAAAIAVAGVRCRLRQSCRR